MRSASSLFALVVALAVPLTGGPSASYFTNVRDVRISQPGQQNYFGVDEEIWARARPDLADLRIYDGESQVQYALREQRGGTSSHEEPAKVLNLGSVGGRTEFDLDMGEIGEYDRIRLQLDAKDFVVTASLAGSNELRAKTATQLPPATLYDFTREELGSNPVLKLPPSSFHYLHVKLSAGISPAQVKGASVYNLQETKTVWTSVGSCGAASQMARTTVISCNSPVRVPVDRVRFRVDPKQVNFRRAVVLSDATDHRYGTSGEITRVRMNRGGTTVVSEEMDVPIGGQSSGQLKITVENGDNPPLAISGVELLSVERRVYFDPQGKSLLRLYYGDDKLGAPVYDYARFFKADPAAAKAELGPGTHNEAYRGRPDDRPWSERHKAVLWLAMLLAVFVLTALAIRGLTAKGVSS
ncbi:MAG: DUF3999 family protein [Terriglobales bacterium]